MDILEMVSQTHHTMALFFAASYISEAQSLFVVAIFHRAIKIYFFGINIYISLLLSFFLFWVCAFRLVIRRFQMNNWICRLRVNFSLLLWRTMLFVKVFVCSNFCMQIKYALGARKNFW